MFASVLYARGFILLVGTVLDVCIRIPPLQDILVCQVCLQIAVILTVGALVTNVEMHDTYMILEDASSHGRNTSLSSSLTIDKKKLFEGNKIIIDSPWVTEEKPTRQNPVELNLPDKIRPGDAPWLVKILTATNFHLHTGALITWRKVLTTCNSAMDLQITYVAAGFAENEPQKRKVLTSFTDERCRPGDIMGRYNVGIIIIDRPFTPDVNLTVIQFPTMNKRKYLELTDQLPSEGSECHFYRWNNEGEFSIVTITAVESYRVPKCLEYQGFHEFICSTTSELVKDDSDSMDGTPIICGEDVYGILTEIYSQPSIDIDNDRCVYIWLRLDEFVQLINNGDDPELEEFIGLLDD